MVAHEDIRSTNAAMSPSSLAVTLAMLADGATGESLASLDEAFGLTGDDRSAAMGALRQALADYEDLPTSMDADDPPEAPVVSPGQQGCDPRPCEINPDFLDRLASYYDTGTSRIPRAEAKADLDAWAKKHTTGLIKESAIKLKPGIVLITQDALLFAAKWRREFLFDDVPLSFTTGDGATGDIDALSSTFHVPIRQGRAVGGRPARLRRRPGHGRHPPHARDAPQRAGFRSHPREFNGPRADRGTRRGLDDAAK